MAYVYHINSTTHQFPGKSCCGLSACVQAIWWHPRHGERLPVAEPLLKGFMASQDALPPCPALNPSHRLDLGSQSLRSIGFDTLTMCAHNIHN